MPLLALPPTSTPAPAKVLGGGVTQVNPQSAATATKPSVAKPATTSAKAPTVVAVTGQVLAPVVKSLPKSVKLTATIVINGKSVSLGTVKTTSAGAATLPAFSAAKAGTYIVQLSSSTGAKYFIKVVVKAK